MASYVELNIDQGTDFQNIINLTDDNTNVPINIYGYSVTSQMRRSFYSEKITSNIICTTSNTSNGEITMSLSAANTSNIKPGRYVFDVKTTSESGSIVRILEGIITVNPQVTK